jgi:hypothetical protein
MSELNRLPISPLTSFGPYSVQNGKPFGTNFSIYGVGGFMEVYSLSDLLYTIPVGMTGNIEYSGNTIPIQFTKGNGSIFSPDVLTLNSDNISSGRRKLGMLVYVYEQNQIYQFNINNYTTLWNSATGATGIGGPTVVISNFGTTIKNNSVAGQNLINSWTANTIEGVSGETSTTAVWKKLVTGGGNQGGGISAFTYSSNTFTILDVSGTPYSATINYVTGLTVNGNITITGNTNVNNLTGNTISATTFSGSGSGLTNIPISGVTNLQSSLDSKFDKSGGTISGNTIFTSGITASTISATTYFNLPISGLTGGNNIGVTNNNSNYRISFTGGVVTATTIFNNGLTSNTLNVTGVTILDGTTISTLNVTGNTILSGITASTLNVTGDTILNSLTATTISATTYLNTPYFVSGSSGTYSLKVRNDKLNDSTGDYAFSINASTRAEGIASFALGSGTTAQENASFAGGINSLAYGKGTFVFGTNSTAFADGTIVLGTSQYGTIPDMTYSQKMSVSGSGTSYPIFNVKGSNGSLFSVYDSVTGTLFSVNNISGLPVFEVLDSDSIKIGTQAISKFSTKTISLTAGTNIVFLIPTSTYTSSFFDYSLSGSSGMRAGNVMSIWSGTTTQYTETSTNDIGNTSGVTFSVDVSGSNARFIASAITSGWTVSTIIKSI